MIHIPIDIEPKFPAKPRILYVDDEQHNLNAFKAALRRTFRVDIAICANDALELIKKSEELYEVIISDQRMPEITGVEFLETIKVESPKSVRMLLTGFADITAVTDAINKGEVYRYMTKPWNEPNMVSTINQGVEVFRLRESNEFKTEKLIEQAKQLEFLARQGLIS